MSKWSIISGFQFETSNSRHKKRAREWKTFQDTRATFTSWQNVCRSTCCLPLKYQHTNTYTHTRTNTRVSSFTSLPQVFSYTYCVYINISIYLYIYINIYMFVQVSHQYYYKHARRIIWFVVHWCWLYCVCVWVCEFTTNTNQVSETTKTTINRQNSTQSLVRILIYRHKYHVKKTILHNPLLVCISEWSIET